MSKMSDNVSDFIEQLKEWGKRETGSQRTAIAELRRGLQEFPNLSPYMHRYLAPFAANTQGWTKQTYYLLAALFALYHSGGGDPLYSSKNNANMGSYFAEVVKRNQDAKPSIERRFNALLTAHPQDLHYHLRQAIALLRSKSAETAIAINWQGLFWDILKWNNNEKRAQVQEEWAGSFWRKPKDKKEAPEPSTD